MRLTLRLASSTLKIEDVSPEWQQEFGMEAAVCTGRTLNLVLGPDSNAKTLFGMLETVQHGKRAEAHVMLYASTGAGELSITYVGSHRAAESSANSICLAATLFHSMKQCVKTSV